ncbi:hypothetical protein QEN19_003528 [Hanseniaspora menglaensis]
MSSEEVTKSAAPSFYGSSKQQQNFMKQIVLQYCNLNNINIQNYLNNKEVIKEIQRKSVNYYNWSVLSKPLTVKSNKNQISSKVFAETVDALVQKYKDREPSFILHLYPKVVKITINEKSMILKNSDEIVKNLLENVARNTIPNDFTELVDDLRVNYYEGNLLVRVISYREGKHNIRNFLTILRPTNYSIYQDILSIQGLRAHDYLGLSLESMILNLTKRDLNLDSDDSKDIKINTNGNATHRPLSEMEGTLGQMKSIPLKNIETDEELLMFNNLKKRENSFFNKLPLYKQNVKIEKQHPLALRFHTYQPPVKTNGSMAGKGKTTNTKGVTSAKKKPSSAPRKRKAPAQSKKPAKKKKVD